MFVVFRNFSYLPDVFRSCVVFRNFSYLPDGIRKIIITNTATKKYISVLYSRDKKRRDPKGPWKSVFIIRDKERVKENK